MKRTRRKTRLLKYPTILSRWISYKKSLGKLHKGHRLVLDVAVDLFNCNDRRALIEAFFDKLKNILGYDNIYLLLRESCGGPLKLAAYKGMKVDEEALYQVIQNEIGLTGKALREKHPIICNDVTNSPDYIKGTNDTLSEMVIPIICDNITWGVLIIDNSRKDAFSKIDQEIVSVLCKYFASALTQLSQYENIEHKNRMERLIWEIVMEAAKEKNINLLCKKVVKSLSQRTNYTQVYVLKVIDENSGATRLIAGSGPGSFNDLSQIEAGGGLVGKTVRGKKTLYFPDVSTSPDYIQVDQNTKSELNIPIMHGDKVLGVISLESPVVDGFGDGDIDLMEILAKHIGVLWVYHDLFKKTKQEALKDPLTKLWNRRYFFESLNKEIKRHERHGDTLCVVMIDLRDFKIINDTYGHMEGDRILIELSEFLTSRMRESDILARYGGDEFVALLPRTHKNEAFAAWGRLKDEVESRIWGSASIPTTLDFGIASFPQDATNPEDIIKLADEHLYENKFRTKRT